jgi:hypothetical protein
MQLSARFPVGARILTWDNVYRPVETVSAGSRVVLLYNNNNTNTRKATRGIVHGVEHGVDERVLGHMVTSGWHSRQPICSSTMSLLGGGGTTSFPIPAHQVGAGTELALPSLFCMDAIDSSNVHSYYYHNLGRACAVICFDGFFYDDRCTLMFGTPVAAHEFMASLEALDNASTDDMIDKKPNTSDHGNNTNKLVLAGTQRFVMPASEARRILAMKAPEDPDFCAGFVAGLSACAVHNVTPELFELAAVCRMMTDGRGATTAPTQVVKRVELCTDEALVRTTTLRVSSPGGTTRPMCIVNNSLVLL